MNFALKAQLTQGEIARFDCTGGEPQDQHRTFAELDPCPEDVMGVLDMTLQEALDASPFDADTKIADVVNWALSKIVPTGVLGDVLPGDTRIQIRKMDSDGRA